MDGRKGGTNNPPSSGTNASDDLMQSGTLVQDGKLSYETGRLDEAETELNRALALNRENAAAKYYLALVKQARLDAVKGPPKASPPEAPVSPPRVPAPTRTTIKVFILWATTGLPELRKETGLTDNNSSRQYLAAFARMLPGIELPTNSLWLDDQGLLVLQGTPKELTAVERLFERLNESSAQKIVAPARPTPAPTLVHPGSTMPADDPATLYTRVFRVGTNDFYTTVTKAMGWDFPPWTEASKNSLVMKKFKDSLRQLFARFGADLSAAPKALFYNDRLGILFVKASGADLDVVEQIVMALQEPPNAEPTAEKKSAPQQSSAAPTGGVLFAGSMNLPGDPIFDQLLESNAPVTPVTTPVSMPEPPPAVRDVYTGPGRHDIVRKLDSTMLERVDYDHLPLGEVLRRLSMQIKGLDPAKTGINFLIDPNGNAGVPKDPSDAGGEMDLGSIVINLSLTNVRLADLLDAIVLLADHPLAYSIHDFAVVFHARLPEALQGMNFKVDPGTFAQGLEAVGATPFGGTGNSGMAGSGGTVVPKVFMAPGVTGGPGANSPENEPVFTNKPTSDSARTNNVAADFLKAHGIVLTPPKEASYNAKRGLLYIKGTKADLKQVRAVLGAAERSHENINKSPGKAGATNSLNDRTFPSSEQIRLKTVFIETDLEFGTIPSLTNWTERPLEELKSLPFVAGLFHGPTVLGIQSAQQAAAFFRLVDTAPGSTILGEPEITMTSGRHAAIETSPVLLRPNRGQDTSNKQDYEPAAAMNTGEDCGQVFDVLPKLGLDGHTIDLNGSVTWTEFSGLEALQGYPNLYNDTIIQPGIGIATSVATSVVSKQQFPIGLKLYDGQTMVLFDKKPLRASPQKHLLVLVTATLVDFAGNRLHSDDDDPLASDHVPPQGDYKGTPLAIDLLNSTEAKNTVQSVKTPSQTGNQGAAGRVASADAETNGEATNQVQSLNKVQPPPPVHLKAYFFEVSGDITNRLSLLPSVDGQAGAGLLGAAPAKISWNDLVGSTNNSLLGEPEITTVSGRKARLNMMKATAIDTGLKIYSPIDASISHSQSDFGYATNEETGSIFEVLPTVADDGKNIDLNGALAVTEFLGLDGSTNGGPAFLIDLRDEIPGRNFKAVLGNRQLPVHLKVPRGQTFILYDRTPRFYARLVAEPWHPFKPGDSWPPETVQFEAGHLVVLLTVTLGESSSEHAPRSIGDYPEYDPIPIRQSGGGF